MALETHATVTRPDGTPLTLSRLNDDLRAAGVYDEAERTQVDAWLKVRNALAHASATAPSDARAETVVAGIRAFLDEHSGLSPPVGGRNASRRTTAR